MNSFKVVDFLGTDPIEMPATDRRGQPMKIILRKSNSLKDGVQVMYNEREKLLLAICNVGDTLPPHINATAITVSPAYYEAIKKSIAEEPDRRIVRDRKSFFMDDYS